MGKKEGIKKKRLSKAEIEQALIDNFISLQKVLTHLSTRFDEQTNKIDKLLELFEISAKSFSEKYEEGYSETGSISAGDTEFLKKLDSLLDQNKTIAKGIMMMEEKIRNKNNPSFAQQNFQQPIDSDLDNYRARNLQRY
jgi:hypothetical protein